MENPSLQLGNSNWAVKEGGLLGYSKTINKYKPIEFNVTRATTGTRINTDGLIEVVPYNLVSYSEEFNNIYWFKPNTIIIPNSIEAPDGNISADTIQCNFTTFTGVGLNRTIDSVSSTFSIFVKKGNLRFVSLNTENSINGTRFDLDNKSLVSLGLNHIYANVTPFENGWLRLSVTTNNSNTHIEARLRFLTDINGIFGGTNGDFYYIWGAQVVKGIETKDYFPTTTRLNIPRINDTNGSSGILVEPQRTNSIRNSTMQGAVVGTPGTLPTNWSVSYPSGLTTTVVGLGVEKGINYIDLKISGTANATVYLYRMQSEASVIVSLNQSWTISTYFKKIQNNLPSGFAFNIVGRPSSLGYSETIAGNYIQNTMTTELLRYTASGVVSNTNTVYADTTVRFDTVIGQTYDFTFRVAAPQLELGSNATSYIPTTTATVTRNADVITKTNVIDLIGQTEGTIFVDANLQDISFSDNVSKVLCDINLNNTVQNRITIYRYNNLLYYDNIVNGVSQLGTNFFTITDFVGKIKMALTYQQNNVKVFVNGVLRNTDTSALIPTCNTFNIGSAYSNTLQWNGTINNALLWKTQLTDEEAINLTTL